MRKARILCDKVIDQWKHQLKRDNKVFNPYKKFVKQPPDQWYLHQLEKEKVPFLSVWYEKHLHKDSQKSSHEYSKRQLNNTETEFITRLVEKKHRLKWPLTLDEQDVLAYPQTSSVLNLTKAADSNKESDFQKRAITRNMLLRHERSRD